MARLLTANFSRLKRDKVFWICIVVIFILSIVNMLNGVRQANLNVEFGYEKKLDNYFFVYAAFIDLFTAIFTCMFVGTEYGDGTIRNKLIIGHKRVNVYLANVITVWCAVIMMLIVWVLGALVGIPSLGMLKMEVLGQFLCLVVSLLIVAAFSAIFTTVAMLSSNKAVTVVFGILVLFLLAGSTGIIQGKLNEPETLNGIIVTAEGGMQVGESKPNPNYVSGFKRDCYEFIVDFLPTGQASSLTEGKLGNPILKTASSVFITVVVTLCGCMVFCKKDVK